MAVLKDALVEMAQILSYPSGNPCQEEVGDLAVIAFYYLLRSGEYMKPRKVKRNGKMVQATRTMHFRVQDFGFWKDGSIPFGSELAAPSRFSNSENHQLREWQDWPNSASSTRQARGHI